VRLELQQQEINSLKEALNANKKKKRKKKVLPLEPSDPNVQGGAFIVILRSKRRSNVLLEQREQEAVKEELAKTTKEEVQR
jgi:hypothetical protein